MRKFKSFAVMLGLAGALLAGPVVAAETDDLKARIDALQKRLDAIEAEKKASADSGTTYSFSGYVKTDVIYDPGVKGHDNYFAAYSLPVNGADADASVGFSARQSRIRFSSQTKTAMGPLSTVIETDFYGGSNVLRLRHAYGQLGGVTVGQTWSILGDEDTYASTVDFDGPVGVATARKPQLRYTQSLNKSLTGQIAIEDPDGGAQMPNLLAALRFRPSWGAINLSGVIREDLVGGDDRLVYGVHAGAHVDVLTGTTRLLATFNNGAAVADYLVGAYGDAATLVDGKLKAQDIMGGFAGITQSWTDNLSSGFYYGWIERDDNAGTKESLRTFHTNVFFNPVPRVTVGLEYIYGEREINDEDGDASRWHLGVQYSF